MSSISKLRLSAAFLCAVVMTGCATFRNAEPPPKFAKPTNIVFSDEGLSTMSDLTVGVHRVPNSDVLITGHQKGSIAGLVFGPLGLAFTDAVDSSAAADKTKNVQAALSIRLGELASPLLQEQITITGKNDAFRFDSKPNPLLLKITGGLIMTFVSDTEVVPYVSLKPALQDAQKFIFWSTRYMAAVGAPRPLVGESSWTADGGKALHEATVMALSRVVKVMLQDFAQPYPRDEKSLIVVETGYPFARMRMQGFGFKLWEDEDTVGFVPKLGDGIVYTGVHILDKSTSMFRTAPADATPMLNMTPSQTQWPGQAPIASPQPFMAPPAQPKPTTASAPVTTSVVTTAKP